jgi:hypothetical protein
VFCRALLLEELRAALAAAHEELSAPPFWAFANLLFLVALLLLLLLALQGAVAGRAASWACCST